MDINDHPDLKNIFTCEYQYATHRKKRVEIPCSFCKDHVYIKKSRGPGRGTIKARRMIDPMNPRLIIIACKGCQSPRVRLPRAIKERRPKYGIDPIDSIVLKRWLTFTALKKQYPDLIIDKITRYFIEMVEVEYKDTQLTQKINKLTHYKYRENPLRWSDIKSGMNLKLPNLMISISS